MISELRLFTDGSVNPQLKFGYGAYLLVDTNEVLCEALEDSVKVKRFEQTSSSKLELQTLLWAINDLCTSKRKILIYTDCQNILGLHARRDRLEKNGYRSKNNKPISNYELYQEFYKLTDSLECEFVKVKGHKRSREKDETDRLFTLVDRASRKALRENAD